MICPNCHKESGSAAVCPFCGCVLSASDPESLLTGLFSAIVKSYGAAALSDSNYLFTSASSDPALQGMLPLLDAFLRQSGNSRLLQAGSGAALKAEKKKLIADLGAASQIHPTDAEFICNCFIHAVNGESSKPAAEKVRKKHPLAVILLSLLGVLILAAAVFIGIRLKNGEPVFGEDGIFAAFSDRSREEESDEHKEPSEDDEPEQALDEESDEDISADSFPDETEPASESAANPASEEDVSESPEAVPEEVKPEESAPAPQEEAPAETPQPEAPPVYSTAWFSVSVPSSWGGDYPYDVVSNDLSIGFYEKFDHDNYGCGHLFTLSLFEDDFTSLPSYQYLGLLTAPDGRMYYLVAVLPSDVQWVEEQTAGIYGFLANSSYGVFSTVQPVNGAVFTPSPVVRNACPAYYLAGIDYTANYGKVWIHQETDYPVGNTQFNDYSAPGYICKPVLDSHGNRYFTGIHLDGAGAEEFSVTYSLWSSFHTFEGICAPSADAAGAAESKSFMVFCDGNLVYTSPAMTGSSEPQSFTIDITDVNELTIVYPPTGGSNDIAVLFDGVVY